MEVLRLQSKGNYLDMSIARPMVQWEDNRDELPANKYMNIEVADPA